MDVILIILGIVGSVLLSIVTYFLGRRKNNSEIKKNEADVIKSGAEAEKLDTENKIAQVELFDKLNKTLTESKQRWEDHNAAIASDPYRSAAESQRQAQEQGQHLFRYSSLFECDGENSGACGSGQADPDNGAVFVTGGR